MRASLPLLPLLVLLLGAALPAAAAVGCADAWPMAAEAVAAEGAAAGDVAPRVVLRSEPQRIVVGSHFRLELLLCPAPGQPPPELLHVDAEMPAHRHGMNYRASVRPLGDGRWRAEGLLLHMPGRWRLLIDLRTAQGPLRLTHDIDLR